MANAMRDRPDSISDPPTPRELLIAWHAVQADPRLQPSPAAAGRPAPAAAAIPAAASAAIAIATGASTAAASTAAVSTAAAIAAQVPGAVAIAAAVTAAAAALGARVITVLDPDYPRELAGIALPPPVL